MQSLIEIIPTQVTWLPHALSGILQIDIGTHYYHLVVLLIELEYLHGYSNTGGRLSHTNRPAEVKRWILTGRSRTPIEIGNVEAYAKNWWNWWRKLQPTWRVYDDTEKPINVVPPGQVERWECLLVPGANGIISVVASLYWWGCAVCPFDKRNQEADATSALGKWREAVMNASWVIERLTLTMRLRRESDRQIDATDGRDLTEGETGDEEDIDELYEDD